jgi:hypothetical protein
MLELQAGTTMPSYLLFEYSILVFVFAVLGLELRAYTLTHSTSPFL